MAPTAESNPQAGSGRPLPKKENDLFRNVVKHYELKQYKKSLKQAESILKKFPNHGETLVMKGLVLNCLGKRDEAHALAKQGLMNDMRSHVCWHVYGLLHRADRNYAEAIKAYKQALRIDSDNLQILRDLSMLQIQMRDLDGFAVTRHTILTLKPNGKINWLAFALAKHLNGDLRGAVSVIDIYLGTLTEGAPELARGFEASELALYRNMILDEIPGNTTEALSHLITCSNIVVDRTSWLITKAKYHLKIREFEECRNTVLDIFARGMTENFKVHSLYMCCVLEYDNDVLEEAWSLFGTRTAASLIPFSCDEKEKLLRSYENELFPLYGKSAAVQRAAMSLVSDEKLVGVLDVFIRKSLVKGVPSLCRELGSFLLVECDGRFQVVNDPVDVVKHSVYRTMVDLVDQYMASLESDNKLLQSDEFPEPPSTTFWTWYCRAGLHEIAGEFEEGIAMLDKCIAHTPTAVDVYELKARLLKSRGDITGAAECLDKGRDLDRQDRYINNQTTRYMLEAGMVDEALNRISMFTKHEGNPEANLYDMQCSWYELALAACHKSKQEWGKSLKNYSAVVKHFDDFQEDQFDFHGYCIRKVTLRAYTKVLRFEDSIFAEDYYFEAASGLIEIYLHLFDNPSILAEDEEPDYSKMTAAERKKAKAIARKKRLQAEKKKNQLSDTNSQQKGKTSTSDSSNDEKELMKKDPLVTANDYAMILSRHCSARFGTWVLQYKVAIRRKKSLLALQALFKMKALDQDHPQFLASLADFSGLLQEMNSHTETVQIVLSEAFEKLLEGKSVKDAMLRAKDAISGDSLTSLPYRVAVAEGLVSMNMTSKSDAAELIVSGGLGCREICVQSCSDALRALVGFGEEVRPVTNDWRTLVASRFSLPQALL